MMVSIHNCRILKIRMMLFFYNKTTLVKNVSKFTVILLFIIVNSLPAQTRPTQLLKD